MAAKVFQRDEHEFLRMAALASPDWDGLRRLVQGGPDWQYLKEVALLHQLDGVLAWRLLAPELAEVVPETVQGDCRWYVGHLEEAHVVWTADVQRAVAALDSTGEAWTTIAGPFQYAPVGTPVWPRTWSDWDVEASPALVQDVGMLAKKCGASVLAQDPDYAFAIVGMPGGTEVDLDARPLSDNGPGMSALLFGGRQRVSVLGLDASIARPEVLVRNLLHATGATVLRRGTRMPLWAAARVSAWIGSFGPAWDAQQCADLLRDDMGGEGESRMWATEALWIGAVAHRLYGVPETPLHMLSGMTDDELWAEPLGVYEPRPLDAPPIPLGWARLYRWGQYPGDEAFLFGGADSIRERVTRGIWVRA